MDNTTMIIVIMILIIALVVVFAVLFSPEGFQGIIGNYSSSTSGFMNNIFHTQISEGVN